jgi:hypothetical protein
LDGLAIKAEGYTRTVSNLAWQVAGVGDADGDGNADIFWRNSSTGENYFYPMSGTTVLATEGYLRSVQDLNWTIAGVEDMDGDGTADIFWRNSSTGENYFYPMNGTTILSGEGYIRTVADRNWRILMVADLDGNGTADILWRNAASGENYIYFMDGRTILPTEGFIRTVAEPSWQVMPYANTGTKRAAGVGGTITSVARSSTKFVALTDSFTSSERVLTSTDGYSWTKPTLTGTPPDVALTFGNNLFVAVGTRGGISTSPDGITWTARSSCGFGCLDDLLSVAWSGSGFAAVGEIGMVFTSPDGITWTSRSTPLGTGSSTKFRSVASSGSVFVAAGMRGDTFRGAIIYSTDGGVNWNVATVTPVSDFEFHRVIWDGSRFLATSSGSGVAGIWTSTDGASWTRLSTTSYINRITRTGTGYIATNGVSAMLTSTDAITWSEPVSAPYNFVYPSIKEILWMADRSEAMVVGGESQSGFIATSTSTDATTWHARFTSDAFTSVLWDGSRFVAIDKNGRIYTSPDGVSWASQGIVPNDGTLRIHGDIVWSGSRYVVVATHGRIISSTDLTTWGNAALYNALTNFVSATWNGTEFAAITSGGFYRSSDGISWPALATASVGSNLKDLAWSSALSRYVIVASGGNIYFSDNGTTWTTRAAAAPNNLRSVIWAGSQFVAVGDLGTIVTSPDGDAWTNRSIASGPTFNAVAYVNGQLIAAGSGGRIFVSSDAISWFESPSGTTRALLAIAASPSRVVAMGDTGDIVSRP